MNITYVTGNANKAKYFETIVGKQIGFRDLDINEIQSLDIKEVVTAKAKAAYQQILSPVLVEDTYLVIDSFGRLPGPFIKWFIDELGLPRLCQIIDGDRSATAGASFAFYDGTNLKTLSSSLRGQISQEPRGDAGFGWNPIFIPEGSHKTLGEMDDKEFQSFYVRIKPFEMVKEFLAELDNKEA